MASLSRAHPGSESTCPATTVRASFLSRSSFASGLSNLGSDFSPGIGEKRTPSGLEIRPSAVLHLTGVPAFRSSSLEPLRPSSPSQTSGGLSCFQPWHFRPSRRRRPVGGAGVDPKPTLPARRRAAKGGLNASAARPPAHAQPLSGDPLLACGVFPYSTFAGRHTRQSARDWRDARRPGPAFPAALPRGRRRICR